MKFTLILPGLGICIYIAPDSIHQINHILIYHSSTKPRVRCQEILTGRHQQVENVKMDFKRTIPLLFCGLLFCYVVWLQVRVERLEQALARQESAPATASKLGKSSKMAPSPNNTVSGSQSPETAVDPKTLQVRNLGGVGRNSAIPAVTGNVESTLDPAFLPVEPQNLTTTIQNGESLTFLPMLGEFGLPSAGAGKLPSWHHGQAVGRPDTPSVGDYPTAWAPRSVQSGMQWLQLGYAKPVEMQELTIYETYNSGAIAKITAVMPNGTEQQIWAGNPSPSNSDQIQETVVPVPEGIRGDQIRIYVDTDKVNSWPEIDAVELKARDGTTQWANSSKASSSYSDSFGGR